MVNDLRGARPSARRELLYGLLLFGVYSLVAGRGGVSRQGAGDAHARRVVDLERRLHLDVEPALNRALAPHHLLRVVADYEYATTYVLSALALLVWLFLRRPALYREARTSLALITLLALGCFLLWPCTPPRLAPAGLGTFVDTVREGRTWGSWGSPLVGHADQLAAMPSLHVGWALWVSAVLARTASGWRVQLLSAVHVGLTVLVVLSTANHWVLDAVAAAVLVLPCTAALLPRPPRAGLEVVPPADAFFLHVESGQAPQHVGGVALLDLHGTPEPDRDAFEALVRSRLPHLPRFTQVLVPSTWWRRARWAQAGPLDWAWHVAEADLRDADGRPGGDAALQRLVGELAAVPLPRDRPLWRVVVARGLAPDRGAFVVLIHHVVADGIGTVAQALQLLEPPPTAALPSVPQPAPWQRAGAAVVGLAQLARESRGPAPLLQAAPAGRRYGLATVPLPQVRAAARAAQVRVTDVVLAALAQALREQVLAGGHPLPEQARVSVPLMLRAPDDRPEGNVTGAVLVDLPLADLPLHERVRVVAGRTGRLRSPTRAYASRLVVVAAGRLLPPPLHGVVARAVYGGRFSSGVVSNMPGPDSPRSALGRPLSAAAPVLPVPPGTPLAVGALGWADDLVLGVATDPALLPDAPALAARTAELLGALAPDLTPSRQPRPAPA